MQSYREEAGSRPLTMQLDPLPVPAGRPDDMSKYRARYEEAMNPFEAFRGRVRLFYLWLRVFLLSLIYHARNRKQHGRIKTSIP
jgi:hypothetical protein